MKTYEKYEKTILNTLLYLNGLGKEESRELKLSNSGRKQEKQDKHSGIFIFSQPRRQRKGNK